MCLDHIIANETYHLSHALPLKLAPIVSSNNVGHLELKNLSANLIYLFNLPNDLSECGDL